MKTILKNHWQVFIIIAVAIISRLPQLLSPGFMADGDECIMGIMAKHFVEGRTVPFFFYGQNYGFAFIEVLAISAGYLLFGMSDYVVKLSVFAMWIAGVIFFYKTLLHISNNNRSAALGFTLLFILAPAWALWSMKARGGYITAFLFSNIVLYISLRNLNSNSKWTWVGAGIASAIIFFSQPLWLAGLLPFLVLGMWKGGTIRNVFLFLCGIAGMAALIFMMRMGVSSYWQPNVIPGIIYPFKIVCRFTYYNFTGFYYLQNAMDAPPVVSLFVYLFSACLCVALVAGICIVMAKPRKVNMQLVAALLSAIAAFAYFFIIDITSPRYALPLTGYAIVLLFIVWQYAKTKAKLVANSLLAALLLSGGLSLYNFKDYKFEITKADIQDAITKIEQRGITHIYSTDPLLYWNFVFYSEERITGRHFDSVDRYIPYIIETDSVHSTAPHKTAVLTRYPVLEVVDPKDLQQLNDIFYLYQNPHHGQLHNMGFEITHP